MKWMILRRRLDQSSVKKSVEMFYILHDSFLQALSILISVDASLATIFLRFPRSL